LIKINPPPPIFICILLSTIFLFIIYMPISMIDISYFHDDDGRLLNDLDKIKSFSEFIGYIINTNSFKFRPIANLQYLFEYFIFKDNLNLYIAYNIFLIQIIIYYFLRIIYFGGLLLLLAFTFIIGTSKFVVYPIWNITGSFESLSAIFFIIIMFETLRNKGNDLRITFLSIALILTSEKYLPFIIFLPFALQFENPSPKWFRAIFYSFLVLVLYALLRLSLGVPILVGTQTDSLVNSFSFNQFFLHISKSIIELLGFSSGPRYLTGFEFVDWVPFQQIYTNGIYFRGLMIGLVLSITTFYFFLYMSFFPDKKYAIKLASLISLMMAASITFRLELRWLLPSYLCLLLILATGKEQMAGFNNLFYNFLMTSFIILSLSNNLYYFSHFRSSLYFAGRISLTPLSSNIQSILNFMGYIN